MSERLCFKCEGKTSSIQIKCSECETEYCRACMNKEKWQCHCCCSDINCCDENNPLKKKKRDREDDEIAPKVAVKRKLQFKNPKIESLLELLSNK